MSVQTTNDLVIYNGEFHHGVDDKRRVQIPARWTPNKSGEYTILSWPKHQAGACLRVLPLAQMAKLMGVIEAMPDNDPKKSVLMRDIGTKSIQVKLDNAGRICIPDEFAKAADISDKAVVAGMLDRFEIWNPARYARARELDAILEARAYDIMV